MNETEDTMTEEIASGTINNREYRIIRTDDKQYTGNTYAYEFVAFVDGEYVATASDLEQKDAYFSRPWIKSLTQYVTAFIDGQSNK